MVKNVDLMCKSTRRIVWRDLLCFVCHTKREIFVHEVSATDPKSLKATGWSFIAVRLVEISTRAFVISYERFVRGFSERKSAQ